MAPASATSNAASQPPAPRIKATSSSGDTGRSVLVWVVDVAAGHRHAQRAQRVRDADRAGVSVEDVGEVLVDLRGLVGPAADQNDAPFTQAGLNRRPVDLAGLELLASPPAAGGLGATHHPAG